MFVAVLCLAACNREDKGDITPRSIEYIVSRHDVSAITATVEVNSSAELDALFDRFCDYTRQGKFLIFRGNKSSGGNAKENTTFTTTSRDEMKRWMARMEDQGKTVTVTYNPATRSWTGMAYVNPPQTADAEDGRLERVTMDYTGFSGREVHAVYTYFWDGNNLVNVDMVKEDFQHYLRNGQPYDAIFYTHNTAHITYDDNIRTSMYIYDEEGSVVEYYLYTYDDGRLVQEEQSGHTYTFYYNSDGFIDSWKATPGNNTALPNGVHCVWENGDVVRVDNANGNILESMVYDTMSCPRGLTLGTKALRPDIYDPIPYWGRHNVTYFYVPDKKSMGGEVRYSYTYTNGYPATMATDNTTLLFEYLE